jgi:hypothetical protein
MTHRDDRRRAPETKARPAGTGYSAEDLQLARLMLRMVAEGKAKSRTEAARKVAHMARGASPEAIVDRLVRLCHRLPVNPARPVAASQNQSTSMQTKARHVIATLRQHRADQHREISMLRRKLAEERAKRQEARRRIFTLLDIIETKVPQLEARQAEIDLRHADEDGATRH